MFDIAFIQSLRLYFIIDLKKSFLVNRIVSSRVITSYDYVLVERCFRAKKTNVTRLEKIGCM